MRAAAAGAVLLMVGPLASTASAGVTDTSETVSVVITSPADDASVTQDVAAAADASESTTEVTFEVSTDTGTTWTTTGTDVTATDGWTTTWHSDGYSGYAMLRATATDGTAAAADTVTVVVDSSPPVVSLGRSRRVFSPNNDGRKDTTTLSALSDEPAELTLEVVDGDGRVRRTWSSSSSETSLIIDWEGRADGRRLPDGRYTLRANGVDRVGLRADSATALVIDTRAARVRSLRIRPRLFTSTDVLKARYRLRDRSRDFKVTLQIRDRIGRIGEVRRRSGRDGALRYRTRYRNGDPLYPGRYSAALLVEDDAGNVMMSRDVSWRMHRPVRARVFKRLEGVGRRIALTFDDCNHPEAWRRILGTLAAWRVKATFFCSGEQIAAKREVARRTVRDGHAIGSHGWDHALLTGRSPSDSEWRIRADARLWWDVARDTTAPLYRPAYGGYDHNVLAAAGATGHGRVVMWDVDSLDYLNASPSAISGRVLSQVRPGSIVLLHVLDRTAAALPTILRGLSQRQLLPVDLHRFFRAGGYH